MGRWKLYAIGGAIAVLLVTVGLTVLFTLEGWWPVVVDIVLTVTALASMLMLLALIAAVIFFIRTLLDFKSELMPVLDSLRQTGSAVQSTASTFTDLGVKPAVRTASVVVGVRSVASAVLGRGQVHKRSDQRQRRRQEIEREMARRGELNGH